MPVRIYALAKELKVDSKDLVTICNRIGITGKGSALASLEDDEVVRVKKFLAGGAGSSASTPPAASSQQAATAAAPIRTAPNATRIGAGSIKNLDQLSKTSSKQTSSESSPAAASSTPAGSVPPVASSTSSAPVEENEVEVEEEMEEEVVTPEIDDVVAEQAETASNEVAQSTASSSAAAPNAPVVESPAVSTPVSPPVKPAAASSTPAPIAAEAPATSPREGFSSPIAGGAGVGKIRIIGSRSSKPAPPSQDKAGGDDKARKPPQQRQPVINLARIPKTNQPAPRPVSNEPAPQKPEIRLTKDAITGHKAGNKAPLEELKQQEAAAPKKPKPAAAPPAGGLTEFKAAAEKARAKHSKLTAKQIQEEEELEARKKGAAGVSAARAERSKKKLRSPEEAVAAEEEDRRNNRRKTLVRRGTNTAAPRKEKAVLELPCSIRNFSEAAGIPAAKVLRSLMGMGKMVTINAALDQATAEAVALDLGVDLSFKEPETAESNMLEQVEAVVDAPESMVTRPPIVTFLGHVDHGKTSLLDYLIGTKIVSGEAGGITQHIRAYQVNKDGRKVSFVDTPGHEAFTEMRARGANVTDIAVLVIAADDGIMPQTEEAISHAKAANVPIVVACNKIDLPGADLNRVMTQLTEHGLTPSEWGGDVEIVPTSAITGQGMDQLLDTLLTVAELHEYKANPNRNAIGVCLEAEQASDRGVIAKVMVRNGTLKVGDIVVCGAAHGRIKALYDTLRPNVAIKEAGPAMPVNITGLDLAPAAGDRFYVLNDIAEAREIAESRANNTRTQSLSGITTRVSFETFQDLLQTGKLGKKEDRVILNLIVRADVRGSLEAIDKELTKLEHPEVEIRVLQRSVGGISVADVTLAHASQAVIVGFNVIPDEAARALAEDRSVEIRRYDIIYKLAEDIKAIIEGRLRPEERVIELGRALVKQVFTISRVGAIAGCYVAQGTIERGARIRVNRDGRTIGDYALDSLKRHKDDAKEVQRGMECGIKLAGFNDIKQDDVLEAYKIEEVARTLD